MAGYEQPVTGAAQRLAARDRACPQPRCLRGQSAVLQAPGCARYLPLGRRRQATSEPPLNATLDRVAAIRRRSRLLAAAAAVVAAIAAASVVQVLHDATARPPAAVASARAVTVQATNPETGTWAAVRYTARPWGTELEVSITGVAPGTRCQLMVTGAQGRAISAGGWEFTASQRPVWYPASVPIQAASLRRFAIIADGKTLVTIQAR